MEMQVLNIPVAEILNMLIMLLGVAIVIIAAISYHKRSSIRMQAALQKIDELSQRMAEQEAALIKQQHLYNLDKRIATIRTQHPIPEKTWTSYRSMLQDIDPSLNGWITTFENRTQLAEREVQFCTYILVYPRLTLDEIAAMMTIATPNSMMSRLRISATDMLSTCISISFAKVVLFSQICKSYVYLHTQLR